MAKLKDLKKRLMQDPKFRAEYARADDEFTLIEALIRARRAAKLTQTELALRLGTTQSAIARLEGAGVSPSFATLRRYAEATDTRLTVGLVPAYNKGQMLQGTPLEVVGKHPQARREPTSGSTADRSHALELLLDFAGRPTVHHNYVHTPGQIPSDYVIRIGSTSGRVIGSAEKAHPGSSYGPFRFRPLEEARELFAEAPMERPLMEDLKAAIAAELRERARELAVEFRAVADKLETA